MRSIWSGTLGVSVIALPVTLGSAVSEAKSRVHKVRRSDGSRIKYRGFAEADGQEVPYGETVRGYELDDGRMVILADADFERAFGPKSRDAKILFFTDPAQVPRTAHDASYYVQPGKGGEKAYALLAEAMSRTGRVAVVSFALRDREALGILYPTANGEYLVLERIQWHADVRQPDFAPPMHAAYPSEAEISQAESLVKALTEEFDWPAYTDQATVKLAEVAAEKAAAGQGVSEPARPAAAPATVDLATALRESLAAVKAAKAAKAPVPVARTRAPRTRKAPAA